MDDPSTSCLLYAMITVMTHYNSQWNPGELEDYRASYPDLSDDRVERSERDSSGIFRNSEENP